jgi:diguanylate cyclase (GGDEF)-like protein
VPQGIAVLFVDVDRFKLLNASVGHAAGDRVLVEIGERLVHVVRPEDTIARFGGDEFVLLCEGLVSTEQAEVIAQRISNCLADPFRIGEIEVTLTVSVGIAMNRDGLTAEDIIRDADAAMTRAKETGKARYEFSDDRMHARANDRLEIESDLRRALERNEFTLHYQPIVDLQHGQIVAAEALLRWNHPTKGEQQPGEFVPVAEETGLINSIGRWVLMQACRQAAEWTAQGHPLSVSVNLSARQLARPGLEAIVANALNDAQLDPSRLCLEITESTLMDEGAPVYEVLRQLKGLGVSLSVDDFGTGYSSLAYLQRFPMDQLKIDRAFVEDLGLGSARSALVGAIVQMGRALEIEVVAEGVENVAQLGDLQRLGCLRAQGFVFAYPMPAEALTQILDEPILPQSPKRTVKMGVVRRAEQPARGASKTQAL